MSKDEIEYVTISKEYLDDLESDSTFLSYLRAVGVDNWEGYSIAQEMFDE